MIKQECIGIPDMILLLMIFLVKKIKIKAEIVLSPGGAYFNNGLLSYLSLHEKWVSGRSVFLSLTRMSKVGAISKAQKAQI